MTAPYKAEKDFGTALSFLKAFQMAIVFVINNDIIL